MTPVKPIRFGASDVWAREQRVYTPALATDLRVTFARIREQQKAKPRRGARGGA